MKKVTLPHGIELTLDQIENLPDEGLLGLLIGSRDPITIQLCIRVAKAQMKIKELETIVEGLMEGSLLGKVVDLSSLKPGMNDEDAATEIDKILSKVFGDMESNGR